MGRAGPQAIAAVERLLGLPAERQHVVPAGEVAVLLLDHANEVTSTITVGRSPAGPRQRYRISGSHGVLLVESPALTVETRHGTRTWWP